ncbi:hypothetical protein WA577_005876, partial [Blastocystis sp. JDR]
MQQGSEYIKRAVEYDEAGKIPEAIAAYREGSRILLESLRFEKNKYIVQNMQMKVKSYIDRAELLKKSQTEVKKPAKAEGGGGNDDDDKLKSQLAQAIVTEKPNIKWEDVAGLAVAKEELMGAVILPTIHPEFFVGKRQPWKGILMYGPPGTGKSYLAKAVASQADSTFMSVSSSDLVSKWQGESARLVKQMFIMAREKKPTVIFIDEIDSLCGSRDGGNSSGGQRQVLNEFLVQMDGVGKDQTGVLVLGATNVPWELDAAIRRRFQKRIYIPLPDEEARRAMFRIHFGKEGHSLTDQDYADLAAKTDGFSGSDISGMVKQALMIPVKRIQKAEYFFIGKDNMYHPCGPNTFGAIKTSLFQLPEGKVAVPMFTREDIPELLKRAVKAASASELERYEKWTKEFGEDGV